jgi:hypothetical protein
VLHRRRITAMASSLNLAATRHRGEHISRRRRWWRREESLGLAACSRVLYWQRAYLRGRRRHAKLWDGIR